MARKACYITTVVALLVGKGAWRLSNETHSRFRGHVSASRAGVLMMEGRTSRSSVFEGKLRAEAESDQDDILCRNEVIRLF